MAEIEQLMQEIFACESDVRCRQDQFFRDARARVRALKTELVDFLL